MPPEVQKSGNSVYPGPKEKGTLCYIYKTSALLRWTVMPSLPLKQKVKLTTLRKLQGFWVYCGCFFIYINLNRLQPYILRTQSASRQTAPDFYSE